MKDLRDPKLLGEAIILKSAQVQVSFKFLDHLNVPGYSANPGPLEKYGDPRLIPSTMPNACE